MALQIFGRCLILILLTIMMCGAFPGAQSYPWVVVIDPGHGGDDYGVRAAGGGFEKDIDLMLAHDLKAILMSDPALDIVLTRNYDRDMSLQDRAILANHTEAMVFISIHCGYSHRRSERGYVVYYYQPDSSQQAAFHELKQSIDGRDVRLIPWDLAQLPSAPASRELATKVQNALNTLHKRHTGSPVGEHLNLLSSVKCPAILIECCTLTNRQDERQILDPTYRRQFCERLRDCIVQFLRSRRFAVSGRRP